MKKKKKIYILSIFGCCMLIFLFCFQYFYIYGLNNADPIDDDNFMPSPLVDKSDVILDEPIILNTEPHVAISDDYEEASTSNERVKTTTEVIFRTHYTLVDKIHEERHTPTYDMIGMTREQVEKKFPDYQMVIFTSEKIVFERFVNDSMDEVKLYMIKNIDGYIGVLNPDGSVKEITTTPVGTLPLIEQRKLEKGIPADEELLLKLLQDYTS